MQFIILLVASAIQASEGINRRAIGGCRPLSEGLYDCGSPSDVLQIREARLTPSRPQAGKPLRIRIQGRLRDEVTFGSKVVTSAKLKSTQLFNTEKDLCRGSVRSKAPVNCPLKPPSFDFQYNTTIPFLAPRGHYTVTNTGISQNNQQIFNIVSEFDL